MNTEVVKEINEHSQGSSLARVEVALVKSAVRCRAALSREQPSAIENLCTENASQAAQPFFSR